MALHSKFSKKPNQFKANKIFTDRVEPRGVFSQSVDRILLAQDPDFRKEIVVFYGKGGIGKTSLLKELQNSYSQSVYRCYPKYTFHNITVSLEAYDYANPVNILTTIRSMIQADAGLFDYALIQYYAKARTSIEEIRAKNNILPGALADVLNEVIGICSASASIPKALIEKCVEFIRDKHFQSRYREEIEEIATLNEYEIFERLPYYLGLCISQAAAEGIVHILFLDSYESICNRQDPQNAHNQWLKELFLSGTNLLLVIGSRDRIDWEKDDPDWRLYLNQHLLANLSDEDSRWFLECVPIRNAQGELHQDIIEHIIRHAGGVPLYLDLCVDLYEDSINNHTDIDFSNFSGSRTIIERYIRHLKEKDQYAVCILSMLKSFDTEFALRLLARQNLHYYPDELRALFEKSVFLPLDATGTLWEIDKSIRLHIEENMPLKWKQTLLRDLLETLLEKRDGRKFPYFFCAVESVKSHPEYLTNCRELFFDAADYFATAGYWNELRLVLSSALESDQQELSTLAAFVELIWLRRTGNLAAAAEFVQTHPLSRDAMGSWYYMYRFLTIHVHHLMGEYDQSILAYKDLLAEMDLVRPLIPLHIYNSVTMKYADLLFLRGQFDDSLKLVDTMLENPSTPIEDMVELLRIKGHIFRFRRQYEQATIIYDTALKLVVDHELRSHEGKLFTNLTEVSCLVEPEVSIEWYRKAMDRNLQMGNEIEVGKAQAAGSVAMTTLGNIAEGLHLAKTAIATAEVTGYRSGKAFGLAALAYAQKQAGQKKAMAQTLAALSELLEQLHVYSYILPEDPA